MRLAFLVHELPPYRSHTLQRFQAELPAQIDVILSSSVGGLGWQFTRSEKIRWHDFGQGASITEQGRVHRLFKERAKGRQIVQKLHDLNPDAVVVCGYGDAAHRLVIRHCHRRGTPALLWADSNIRSEPSRGLRRTLKHLLLPPLLRKCSAVLPWGTYGKQYFLKYGVPEGRIFIVPAEPDYSLIENTPHEAIEAMRQRLNLDPARKRILFVGRLAPEKRVDLLIDAFIAISGDRLDWDLLIVGDGPLRTELQDRVPPPISNRVIFTGALTTPDALAPIYHLAHLFVLPSDHEPWGIVVNEAATAGLPLVLSDAVGAGRELLRRGVNGEDFTVGNVNALAKSLVDITGGDRVAMATSSRHLLTGWRNVADPVVGLRRALQ